MTNLSFNVTGPERKRLVVAIADFTWQEPKYLGVPSCAYQVGGFTVSKDGCVSFDEAAEVEQAEELIQYLAQQGFTSPDAELEEPEPETPLGMNISFPLEGFDEGAIERLRQLIASKGRLIQKALAADRLTVRLDENAVAFPWWDTLPPVERATAYACFLERLCQMAKKAKRVTATEKDVESEKYAFRGFLLRLGFIGSEWKEQRKLLLENLTSTSAFPNRAKAEAFSAAQKAKREAARAQTQGDETPDTGADSAPSAGEVEAP